MEVKFNFEEYSNGYESLDDAIFEAIINKLTVRLENRLTENIDKKITKIIDESIKVEIEKKISVLLDNFLDTPIDIEISWNKKEHYNTKIEYIQHKMEETYAFSECKPGNIMLEKINSLIKSVVTAETQKANTMFKKEGEIIAKKAIDDSNIYKALQTLTQ